MVTVILNYDITINESNKADCNHCKLCTILDVKKTDPRKRYSFDHTSVSNVLLLRVTCATLSLGLP